MRGSKKREPSSAFDPVGDGGRGQGSGEGALAPSRTRGRARARATGGGGRSASGRAKGAKRHAAMRDLMGSVRDRAMGAKRPSRCSGRARISNAGTCKRSAQRARASEGARDRHPKGEDRVSGLRGAGRGEAAPGGIEPGARSLDRAGAPIMPVGQRAISGRHPPRLRTGHAGNKTRHIEISVASNADRREKD